MGLSVGRNSCDNDGRGEGGWEQEWVDGFISLRDESESVCGRQAGRQAVKEAGATNPTP
jgi:hypothetical protein